MTFSRFFGFGFLLWLLVAILKAAFFGTSVPLQIVYALLVCVLTLACCRRVGVINILEGAMVAGVWTSGILLADWILLYHGLHLKIFSQGAFWWSYLIILVTIFFGHKKRHIQIRQELAAHSKHGHH